MTPIFKKTVLFSFLSHLTVFSIFSFSFVSGIQKLDYGSGNFWGAVLSSPDLTPRQQVPVKTIRVTETPLPSKPLSKMREAVAVRAYLKPTVDLSFNAEKQSFAWKALPVPDSIKRRDSVIMFYPRLPDNFFFYFQDRQVVHIELMFNISSSGEMKPVAIKRKISSGNLDADLFTLRYIENYLSVRQPGFPRDSWQAVKIDLSKKND